MKEEQKLKRQQLLEHQKIERDAREQEKENERRLKEAERRAREEELTRRREEKRQQEEMALKAQQSLMTNFFGAPRPISPVAKPKGESTLFQPWQEPEYATIARPHRCSLRPISLDSLNSQTVDLRDVLRGVKHRAKRWIRKRGSGRVFKLLQFHTEYRPAYFGTFSKRSRRVCGRNPFAKDDTIDYTYDSDDEWEDESEGESLSSAEDDEDEEMMDQPGIPVRRDGLVEDGWLMPENEDHFTSVDVRLIVFLA